MKKLLIIAISVVSLFSFSACNSDDDTELSGNTNIVKKITISTSKGEETSTSEYIYEYADDNNITSIYSTENNYTSYTYESNKISVYSKHSANSAESYVYDLDAYKVKHASWIYSDDVYSNDSVKYDANGYMQQIDVNIRELDILQSFPYQLVWNNGNISKTIVPNVNTTEYVASDYLNNANIDFNVFTTDIYGDLAWAALAKKTGTSSKNILLMKNDEMNNYSDYKYAFETNSNNYITKIEKSYNYNGNQYKITYLIEYK